MSSPLDELRLGEYNPLNTPYGRNVDHEIYMNQISEVTAESLDEIASDPGAVTDGEIIAPDAATAVTSTEPTETGFTGPFMSAVGRIFNAVVYNFGIVVNGVLVWGASNAGDFLAAGGAVVANALGFFVKAVGGSTYISFTSTRALFGSDISSPNTTALAVFFTAQTYNAESMEAGSMLFGSNSSTYANVMWQPSTKRLLFRNGTSTQAYVDTNGAITWGGGVVKGDASGMSITSALAYSNAIAIKWYNAVPNLLTTIYATFAAGSEHVLNITADPVTSESSKIKITSTASGSSLATIEMTASGSSGVTPSLNISSGSDPGITANANVRVNGYVMVQEMSAPATPPSGMVDIYAKTDHLLYIKDSTGAESVLLTGVKKTPIYSSGLGNTVAGASTAYLGMHPQAPNATESNVQAQAPFTGTKKNLRLRTLTSQPAGGNMVVTLREAGSDTSVTFTIAAGAAAGTFADTTNSAAVTAANAESIKCVNNAAGASAQIGQYSMEYDAT